MFHKLIEYLSLNKSINMPITYKNLSVEKTKFFMEFCTLRERYNILDIFKIWYTIDIQEILFENDNIINIDRNITDLSTNYYLASLISKNNNTIDFSYSLEYLQNILNEIELKKEQKYCILILSKIIFILLDNYKNNDNNEDESQESFDNVQNKIENLKSTENIDDEITQLYLKIIKSLITNTKIENYEEAYNIIKEIEIEKIDITKNMFDDITELFKEQKIKEEYSITKEIDFKDIKKINFYYLFLKYIFKTNIFIYDFELFLETRNFLINKVKSGCSLDSIIVCNDNNIFEKGRYIIETLLDLDYYKEKLRNNKSNIISSDSDSQSHESIKIINESIKNDTSLNEDNNNSNLNISDYFNQINSNTNTNSKRNISSLLNMSSNQFITESNNKEIIQYVNIINKTNAEDKYQKSNLGFDFIIEINNSGFICWGSGQNIELYDIYHKKVSDINLPDEVVNNLIVVNAKEDIFIIACSISRLYKIIQMNYNILKNFGNDKEDKEEIMSFIFEYRENKYLICFEDKVCFFSDLFDSEIVRVKRETHMIPSVISVIKISEEYIALKSCSFNDKNLNKIMFFNTFKYNLHPREIKGYSFIFSHGGLSLIPRIQSDSKNKVLLCACKKYSKLQKNGILLLNTINIQNEEDFYTYFYDTNDFEVYCFCPILIIKAEQIVKNDFNYIDTDYFLVGGFDTNKYIGNIKLFKINFDNLLYENKIEFIQDLDYYQGFKSPISCIIQEKFSRERNLLVTCLDGNIYLFSGPYIEYYLKLDEEIKGDVSYYDFFKTKL